MKALAPILLAVSLLACHASRAANPLDAAERAVGANDFAKARDLYKQAAAAEKDPKVRDRALVSAANIEWRVMRDAAAARATLARVPANSSEAVAALVERARLELEVTRDFATAKQKARAAVAAATKRSDRRRALLAVATTSVQPVLRARRGGQCVAADELREVQALMRGLIEKDGPLLAPVSRLLDASLLLGDGATTLQAFRWYYALAPGASVPNKLVAPAAELERLLPAWRGNEAPAADRRALGLAFANARMFAEAELVLRDPCAKELPHDAETDAVVAYARSLDRIRDVAEEHYRNVALGNDDARPFRKRIEAERNAQPRGIADRFGAVVTMGKTGGVNDVHYMHAVIDEQRNVEQYGRTATLRFVALDGIVSNGYNSFQSDGRSGDGGWGTKNVIYQVRPLYADGPVRLWLSVADPEIRKEVDADIAEETQRDVQRAAAEPIRTFEGLIVRMRRQDAERLLAETKGERDAFVAKARDEKFATSIWAHEGRHAIDDKYEHISNTEELEYRAKLSELALTPAPRNALYDGILGDVGGSDSPHGRANKRLAVGLVEWMGKHGFEPRLMQLDKLSDQQIREAARSLDPLAH